MYVHLSREGIRAPAAAGKSGRRPGRLAGVLAAVSCGLLASVLGPVAAFAMTRPDSTGGGGAGVTQPVVHVITAAGMAGWQIAMIALGAALVAATATMLIDRTVAARRAASATTA
jgi:hypothetical protein